MRRNDGNVLVCLLNGDDWLRGVCAPCTVQRALPQQPRHCRNFRHLAADDSFPHIPERRAGRAGQAAARSPYGVRPCQCACPTPGPKQAPRAHPRRPCYFASRAGLHPCCQQMPALSTNIWEPASFVNINNSTKSLHRTYTVAERVHPFPPHCVVALRSVHCLPPTGPHATGSWHTRPSTSTRPSRAVRRRRRRPRIFSVGGRLMDAGGNFTATGGAAASAGSPHSSRRQLHTYQAHNHLDDDSHCSLARCEARQ